MASNALNELLRSQTDLTKIEGELHREPFDVVDRVAYGRRAIVGASHDELPEIEQRMRVRLEEFVPASRTAVSKIRRDKESAKLSRRETEALEAIILLLARPALLIQDGAFFKASEPWAEDLEARRADIESQFSAIGRIEVTGHPALDWVGTGWMCAADVLMTNRHVAKEFADQSGTEWTFAPGMQPSIDFGEELGGGLPRDFKITEVIGVHGKFDLALLRVSRRGSGGLAAPLALAGKPIVRKGSNVLVVGYPAADSRRNDPEEMQRIFSGIYNVKRLQPGKIRSVSPTKSQLIHDCSTLGGNSGSCVLDLESQKVVGLHFGGRYLSGNKAVALWRLRDDRLLRDAGITFD